MAHALFFRSSMDSPQYLSHDSAPPCSPAFQVPDVLLVGPDEEEDGPWLLFDAAKDSKRDLSRTPDLEFLDIALDAINNVQASVPVFHRRSMSDAGEGVVMPRRGDFWLRKVSVGDEATRMETQHIAGDDSVVVEVVKVRRGEGYGGEGASRPRTTKKSDVFKAAASKAFHSIKNVAKGSNRKPNVQDVWNTRSTNDQREKRSPSSPEQRPQPRTPVLSRRSSTRLSQLFSSPNKTPRASSDITNPPHLSAVQSEPDVSAPCPLISDADASPSLDLPVEHDRELGIRPASPSLSMKPSFRRRLSNLELGGLFTSSSKSPPYHSSSSSKTLPLTPAMSRDTSTNSSSTPSTSTEASLDTPDTADDAHSITPFAHPNDKPRREGWPAIAGDSDFGGDISFEMRLDSLHFDSLSFHPDEF